MCRVLQEPSPMRRSTSAKSIERRLMDSSSRQLLAAALIFLILNPAMAAVHHVGGNTGWTLSSDLQTWLDQNKFYVGDILVFEYPSEYDVRQVSQLAYTTCDPTTPLATYNDGFTRIQLTEAKPVFFVDGRAEYCKMGMMMEVNVLPQP